MKSLRWVLTAGVLVLVANGGCAYKNARQARTHQTVLATGWSCAANPDVRCGETGECSGWEDEWRATCPSTGTAYHCYFDRKYKNNETHVTCDVDASVPAIAQPAKSTAQASDPTPTVTSLPSLPVGEVSQEGYRESRWGMSPANVQQAFPTGTESGGGVYVLAEPVAGKATTTGFVFAGDRLVQTTLMFTDTHVNANNYLRDFQELKDLLTKKYGKPFEDATSWSQDLYRDDPTRWGFAVSAGHLRLITGWQTEKTLIRLVCVGEDFKVKLRVFYFSKELEAVRKATFEKKDLEGL